MDYRFLRSGFAGVAAVTMAVACSSSSSGAGSTDPTAFLGTWTCTAMVHVTYKMPAGQAPVDGTQALTLSIAKASGGGILVTNTSAPADPACPPCDIPLTVSGSTATVSNQSCTAGGCTQSISSANLVVNGNSLSGSESKTISNSAENSTGNLTVQCSRGAGAASSSGGSSGDDGGSASGGSSGGSASSSSSSGASSSGSGGACMAPGGACSVDGDCCQSGAGLSANGAVCVSNDNACHAVCTASSDCTSTCCLQLSGASYGVCGAAQTGVTCL